MSSRFVLIALALAAGLSALLWLRPRPAAPELAPAPAPTRAEAPSPPPTAPPAPPAPVAVSAPEPLSAPPPPADDSPAPVAADLARIEAAVVTYEPASLPVIAPYLAHANPEVREAARHGLLQMGLAEGAPLLREAAGKMKDPREAIELLDAADFLELPTGTIPAGTVRRTKEPPPSYRPPGSRR